MQTQFTESQLALPALAQANEVLRTCVHCGLCLATCPTYALLGDERDSPRGRIYLIKDMLEQDAPADATVTRHIDRCLSCLSCMTTCPAGVDYMHLVDHARGHIERTWERPLVERAIRTLLGAVLPRPGLARLALLAARGPALLAPLFGGRLGALLRLAGRPSYGPSWAERPQVIPAQGERRKRVALLTGCVQCVLAPEINEAAVRVLTRHGCEVVVPRGAGCCGALPHHLGDETRGHAQAGRTAAAFAREAAQGELDAVVATASGCGTMLKDYGHLLKDDETHAEAGAQVAGLARDVSEVLDELGVSGSASPPTNAPVAYHSACSLQHGQKIDRQPMALLAAAGFTVRTVPDGHFCCGSAGTYNMLQPTWPVNSARARRRRSRAPVPRSWLQAISAAWSRSPATPRCRWCTRWSCSTGRRAGRARLRLSGSLSHDAGRAKRAPRQAESDRAAIGTLVAIQDAIDVTTERINGVLSVAVEGRIDGSTVMAFQEAIESAVEDGDRAVIVNCERLHFIGSAGLRTVLAIAKSLSNRDTRFALCSLSDQVRVVFEKSGFDTIIAIHPSQAEALAFLDG